MKVLIIICALMPLVISGGAACDNEETFFENGK